MVSGSISPSLSDCFSPFPHGTGSLSVTRLYLALAGSPAGFPPTFLDPTVLRKDNKKCKLIFTYRAITFYGVSFQKLQLINLLLNFLFKDDISLQPPNVSKIQMILGYSPFARRYWGNHFCSLFLRLLRCFTSPGLLL